MPRIIRLFVPRLKMMNITLGRIKKAWINDNIGKVVAEVQWYTVKIKI